MSGNKRTITRKIDTEVSFTNKEVKALLLKAAGAPAGIGHHDVMLSVDGDSFFEDLEISWTVTETQESDE